MLVHVTTMYVGDHNAMTALTTTERSGISPDVSYMSIVCIPRDLASRP